MRRQRIRVCLIIGLTAAGLLATGCRKDAQGPLEVTVVGDPPQLRDPALRSLSPADALLLQSVAQGLVSFDANGNIVSGLAERWTVSDDGLSYIFRLANKEWSGGGKVTAQQVARVLKRALSPPNKNAVSDALGAVDEVVAMTDRVIEIRLQAPRPNLLSILAQPEMAIIRSGRGTGPFETEEAPSGTAGLRLTRAVFEEDDEEIRARDTLILSGQSAPDAVKAFASGQRAMVLGGTFVDLGYAARVKLPRGSLRFDPASGLFGLVPTRSGQEALRTVEARRLLSEALDREVFVAALGVPNLAPRATVLEPGLDGTPPPQAPAWVATPLADRLPGLQGQARRLFGDDPDPIRVSLPEGPGADLLLRVLQRSWGALGLRVERAKNRAGADFQLIDQVAPSASPAWFVRRFRCEATPVCDEAADALMDQARTTLSPPERYALLGQAAALIDQNQLFIPLTAPVRWSLVGSRIKSFAGNRFARHSLIDLEQKLGSGD